MHQSKLVELYRVLSPQEIKQLTLFLKSPYFNVNEDNCKLFFFITSEFAKKEEAVLTKKAAFQFVFPRLRYNDAKIRRLMSNLMKDIERFLSIESFKEEEVLQRIRVANIYLSRSLPKHFNSTFRLMEQAQEDAVLRDSAYYYKQYLIEEVRSNFLSHQRNRKIERNLQKVSDSLDVFYLAEKLRQSCKIVNFKSLVKHDYDIRFFNEILNYVEQGEYNHISAIQMHYYALLMLQDDSEERYFYKLKDLLSIHFNVLIIDDMRNLHAYARNYCIRKSNRGATKFLEDLLDLYKLALKTGLLFKNEVLPPSSYKNIVTAGIKLKDLDWTEEFIHEYKARLPEKDRDGIFAFNLANLYFAQKDYEQVITLLHRAQIDDLLLNLNVKTMLAKTYYELDEEDVLYSLLDSFKMFVIRKKGLGYHKDNYLNIIKFMKRLLTISPYDKEKLKKLDEQIRATRVLTEKRWLIEKLKDLL